MTERAYIVVPFARTAGRLGPGQALMFSAPGHARVVAEQIAARVAGVAVLERRIDPETGDGADTIVAEIGAVPPAFPDRADWSVPLN